jgi:hypothetical protein
MDYCVQVSDFGLSKVKETTKRGKEKIDVNIATESLAIGQQKAMLAHTQNKAKKQPLGSAEPYKKPSPEVNLCEMFGYVPCV